MVIYVCIQVEVDDGPELWLDESEDLMTDHSNQFAAIDPNTRLLHLFTFFLLMFQTLFHLSDTALNTLMTFLAMFFRTLSANIKAIPHSLQYPECPQNYW